MLHLDEYGYTVFTGDSVHLVLSAPSGKNAPGLDLVTVLPEENPHELLEVGFWAEESEGSPEIRPVADGGADGPGPGADHPEYRGRLRTVRHRLLDLVGDPVGILRPSPRFWSVRRTFPRSNGCWLPSDFVTCFITDPSLHRRGKAFATISFRHGRTLIFSRIQQRLREWMHYNARSS